MPLPPPRPPPPATVARRLMPRDWPRASLNCCCLMSSSWVMLYLASAGSELAAMSARSLLVWSRPWARSGAMASGLVAIEGFRGGSRRLLELGEASLPGGALGGGSVVGDGGE